MPCRRSARWANDDAARRPTALSWLDEAFAVLSPQLIERYLALLDRELSASPELDELHRHYLDYAVRDRYLPRPVLAYFGYHATRDTMDFTDLPLIGDGLLIAQLLRDVLAIHVPTLRSQVTDLQGQEHPCVWFPIEYLSNAEAFMHGLDEVARLPVVTPERHDETLAARRSEHTKLLDRYDSLYRCARSPMAR